MYFAAVYVHGLDDLESTCTAVVCATSRRNMEVNCSPILEPYCCDISEGQDIIELPPGLKLRRQGAQCLSTMEVIEQRGCLKAKTMAGTSQARVGRDDLLSSLAHASSNITIKERRITTRL